MKSRPATPRRAGSTSPSSQKKNNEKKEDVYEEDDNKRHDIFTKRLDYIVKRTVHLSVFTGASVCTTLIGYPHKDNPSLVKRMEIYSTPDVRSFRNSYIASTVKEADVEELGKGLYQDLTTSDDGVECMRVEEWVQGENIDPKTFSTVVLDESRVFGDQTKETQANRITDPTSEKALRSSFSKRSGSIRKKTASLSIKTGTCISVVMVGCPKSKEHDPNATYTKEFYTGSIIQFRRMYSKSQLESRRFYSPKVILDSARFD